MKVSLPFYVAGLAIAILSIAPANAARGKAAVAPVVAHQALGQATPLGSDAPGLVACTRKRAET
jgi:hypothetical protein